MARYALLDKKTGKVVNVIEWDGVTDISWLLEEYDIIPAHDPVDPSKYVGDIGDYYDPEVREFKRPIAIRVNKQVVFKGRVRLNEIASVIAERIAGRAPTDVVEILYWEDAEKEEA